MIRFQKLGVAFAAIVLSSVFWAAPASAAQYEMRQAADLDELLRLVRERRLFESEVNEAREREFLQRRDQQANMLAEARATRRAEEQRSDRLETTFEENERMLGQLQEQLDTRLGSLRELFGVLQQVAGDTVGVFTGSIISAQLPGREAELQALAVKMGTSSQLASIEEIEALWIALQQQMTESGKVVTFPGTVIMPNGDQVETDITRVGEFNLIANGGFVNFSPDTQSIVALARQPSSRFTATVGNLEGAAAGQIVPFAVDPTRGSLLSLLIQGKTIEERIQDGGTVGYVIITLGAIGILIALLRLVDLTLTGAKVRSQMKNKTPDEGNPLGRVLKIYQDNKGADVETLELKLAEGILGELPKINRGIALVQVISVVSPLLGLLGTVIGMILTFQAITLFGTGDPKTMAGGISTALMTTVLGLCSAIPTLLLHAIVNGNAKSLIHVLEEQSAGMIAEHAEESGEALG
ncbi:MAG: MotA/TolQ/ExbB proton channel family protein [Pseudomonadales bacterium]|jgi:biopolymer transport protein ExbB|nr:MotA/TolQ/ExbB proton channel family protein [Pseudomonadales bacterium]